jgi:hypothetical protein
MWALIVIVLYTGTTASIPVSGEMSGRNDLVFNSEGACVNAANLIISASQQTAAGRQHVTVMPACIPYP